MIQAAAAGSYAGELARFLRCEYQAYVAMMLHAYCDESYSGDHRTTPIYVVAGFLGVSEQWELFESLWRQSMKELGIEKLGCHAAKCANGAKPYRHLNGETRANIQYRLIVDIVAAKLHGVVAIVDVVGYNAHKDELFRHCVKQQRQYFKPHVLATGQLIQHMCEATAGHTDERIAFVVDRNKEYGGRVRAIYNITRDNPEVHLRHRLGPYAEDDRMSAVGLQAADMLAYSAFRYATGNEGWQWKQLESAVPIYAKRTGAGHWVGLIRALEAANEELRARRKDDVST